jgi:uncharacterized protein
MTKKKSYRDLLKDELLEIARKLGLTNLSRLRKEEIADLVERAATKQERAKTAKSVGKPSVVQGRAERGREGERGVAIKPTSKPKETASSKRTEPPARRIAPGSSTPERAAATANEKRRAEPHRLAEPSPLAPVSDQSGAVASKFTTATTSYRPDELSGVDEALPDLPESYGDNRIVLLPRDLSWLFTYWDLTGEYKEAARAAGGSVLALRLYDVTGVDFDGTNAHAMVEHECAEWARSWYIPTPAPDRDYVVEIGYRGGDQWFPLARSNRVSVPSDQPSTWIKDDFITIRFDEDLREIRERLAPPPPEGVAQAVAGGAPHTLFDDGELRIMVGGAFLPPSGAPTWPPSSGAVQALPSSQQLVPGSVSFIPGSAQVAGSVGFLAGAPVAGSVAFLPGSLAPGSLYQLPSSGAFFPAAPFELPSSPGFVRPPPPRPPGGGPTARPPAPGQPPAAAGAAPDGLRPTEPEPPVVLATVEMVISGRSVPGAELRIAGRTIPMGPDGAFSLRVTVPEGLRELPIEARWAGGSETRRIKLRLGRESE